LKIFCNVAAADKALVTFTCDTRMGGTRGRWNTNGQFDGTDDLNEVLLKIAVARFY
jgi:hypothetical protein